MHIFLIRHGESITNSGENYVKRLPDHLVSLSEAGKKQTYDSGLWLSNYCQEQKISFDKAKIWLSPHLRTRQTCEIFNSFLNIKNVQENIILVEQQYGLFDCLEDEKWEPLYPSAFEEYQRQRDNYGKFYARFPLGESPFDVAVRMGQFIYTINKEYEDKGIDTLFVFTHGVALRTFLLRWFNYSPEWYHDEENPPNCSIREIKDDQDCGYINL